MCLVCYLNDSGLELLANLLQKDDLIRAYKFKKKKKKQDYNSDMAKKLAHPQFELNVYDVSRVRSEGQIVFNAGNFLSLEPERLHTSIHEG